MGQSKDNCPSVLFIFRLSVDEGKVESQMVALRESGPSLHRPSRQCFTTRLRPQLLSKWQTVWQSQVVGNLSLRPLKQAAPGPSLQPSQRQTSDKQVFVLDHVVPSSPFLFSPPRVLTGVSGQLCYGLTGSAYCVFHSELADWDLLLDVFDQLLF